MEEKHVWLEHGFRRCRNLHCGVETLIRIGDQPTCYACLSTDQIKIVEMIAQLIGLNNYADMGDWQPHLEK